MSAAIALLKRLVGEAHATKVCLPLDKNGDARGALGGKHLSSTHPEAKKDAKGIARGGRAAAADARQLHFLITAGCFDSSAIARLKKFSKHDVDAMTETPLRARRAANPPLQTAMGPPPPRLPKSAAAAASARRRRIQREPREDAKGIGATDGARGTRGKRGGSQDGDQIGGCRAEEDSSDSEGPRRTNREPETFSDVDDDEVADYIHTDEEVKLRRVIWSELNREYLETQAAKDAAVASAPPGETAAPTGRAPGRKTETVHAPGSRGLGRRGGA